MIGKLRHAITIQRVAEAADGSGGFTATWSEYATSFAEITPASARERSFGHQIEHDVTHRVTMRYQAGIVAKMRILFGSRIFQIHGVINRDERSTWLDLLCEEGVQA